MKKIIIVFLTVFFISGLQTLYAQSEIQNEEETVEPVKNVIYFELFGNGGVYSFNYERRVTSSIWMRSGFSNFSLFGDYITVPLTASYVFGSSTVSLEAGMGFTFFYGELPSSLFSASDEESGTEKDLGFLPTGIVGLRFQPDTHNLFMKLAFTPFYNRTGFLPFAGLSMGYSF